MDANAFFRIDTGLYFLAARDGGRDNACIVNAVSLANSRPYLLTLALCKIGRTFDMIARTSVFNLTALSRATPYSVFADFGLQSGLLHHKFEGRSPVRRANGAAWLPEYSCACFECAVIGGCDAGMHRVFLAKVERAQATGDAPPLTYDFYLRHIRPENAPLHIRGYKCLRCGHFEPAEHLPDNYCCPDCHAARAMMLKLEFCPR